MVCRESDLTGRPFVPAWPRLSVKDARELLIQPGSPFEVGSAVIDGRPTRVWRCAPCTLKDVVEGVRRWKDRTFIVYEDERVTFDAFHRAVATMAGDLRRRGVEPGDRVALAMRNLPEWPVAFYAAACLGAIVAPLNAWWTSSELAFGLSDCGARIAIFDGERFERLAGQPALAELEAIYIARPADERRESAVIDLAELIGPSPAWANLPDADLPTAKMGPDDPATIFYTSGTTGRPKGAVGSHRNINTYLISAPYAAALGAIRAGMMLEQPDPESPQRAQLLAVPFFHVTGFTGTLNPALHNGSKLVLMRKWDAGRAFELIERERVNIAGGVPFIAAQLLEDPRREAHDLTSLQLLTYGGAPCPPDLPGRIAALMPGVQVATGWGLTETMVTCVQHAGEDYLRHPDSCGLTLAVCEVEARDEAGAVLPPDGVGELWARGPNTFKGYWRNPEATAATLVDGWVRSGDLGRIDQEGRCYIVDRKKDMLIRGGENIYCIELEDVLLSHPAVAEAAVVGRSHPGLGEEPAAVVTLHPGARADEAALRTFMAERLAAYKVAVRILVSPEPLPRNAAGKVLKPELRPLVEASGDPPAARPQAPPQIVEEAVR